GGDAVEQDDVLLDVGVDLAPGADSGAGEVVVAGHEVGRALVADGVLGGVLGAAVDRAAHAPAVAAVLEGVVDGEVVVALAEALVGVDLLAAHADAGDGHGVAEGPAGDVEVVDVLLDDVVAAEPEEVVPVVDLVGHVVHAGPARADPD